MAKKSSLTKQKRKSSKSTEEVVPGFTKVSSAPLLLSKSAKLLWRHKKVLGGIMLVYAILQLVLVQGVLRTDFSSIHDTIDEAFNEGNSELVISLISFSYLLGTTGQTGSSLASTYQFMLLVVSTLAFIWTLRHIAASEPTRIRDGFYEGMTPLIPFLLVLLVIGLQLIPFLIGSWLYSTVITNGIAVSGVEQAIWLVIMIAGTIISAYFILSSVFAAYIVTLPKMRPLQALRSAGKLVRKRRLLVLRKMLFLAVILLAIATFIIVPLIFAVPAVVPWVFYILSIVVIGITHTYMYGLYRELIDNG